MTTKNEKLRPLARLIWIDLEMSGLSPEKDKILEVALIITDNRLNVLAESEEWAVFQPDEVLDGMSAWNLRTHGESGLIDRCRAAQQQEAQVERAAIKFLGKWAGKGVSPMCGNSICQDRRFLARHMPALERYFHYRNFDVSSFKIAAQLRHPALAQQVKEGKRATHQAMDDIRASIDEMRLYIDNMLVAPEAEAAPPE